MTFSRVHGPVRVVVASVVLAVPLVASGTAAAAPEARRIHDIQGRSHVSPVKGEQVTRIPGVVTAVSGNGFWLQDPAPDRDPATSEGIFVFTRTRPTVATGDTVRVDGRVSEFRPGGAGSANLSRTEIDATATTVDAHGAVLPDPTALGPGGRTAPRKVIEDDATGDAEVSGTFDPAKDGLDFYESLEGMRVAVDDAVAVGPRSSYGEVPVLPSGGAGVADRTVRAGLLPRPGDAAPERVVLDDALAALPVVNVGDRFPGRSVGVMDYGFGEYRLLPTVSPRAVAAGPPREVTRAPAGDEFALATLNLDNLDPGDPSDRFAALGLTIVTGLRSPDVVVVEELQDNSGPQDDGTVAADETVAQLITAISAAGGPAYDWRSVDPENDADGGEAGGNIRVGFLFRADRGLEFVDRPGGTATSSSEPVADGTGDVRLTESPGRVAPSDPAWESSRKPLAGEFTWRSRRLIVLAAHWNSTGGDDPAFGRFQPPRLPSEARRVEQAAVVSGFVRSVRKVRKDAYVVVAGDLNAGESAKPLRALTEDSGLRDLTTTLPPQERYTYILGGAAEARDHVLLSPGLAAGRYDYDVVHLNAEYADQSSDHDPAVVRLGPR